MQSLFIGRGVDPIHSVALCLDPILAAGVQHPQLNSLNKSLHVLKGLGSKAVTTPVSVWNRWMGSRFTITCCQVPEAQIIEFRCTMEDR